MVVVINKLTSKTPLILIPYEYQNTPLGQHRQTEDFIYLDGIRTTVPVLYEYGGRYSVKICRLIGFLFELQFSQYLYPHDNCDGDPPTDPYQYHRYCRLLQPGVNDLTPHCYSSGT